VTPRVAAPVLVQVVTRAGHQCECTGRGCHGRSGRCERTWPTHRLVAAPADVTVPVHASWRVPPAALAAWCGRCLDAARAAGRRDATAAGQAKSTPLPIDGDLS